MSFWNRRVNDNTLPDIIDLSHPPETGGRVKIVLLGIILPLAAIGYAWHGWQLGKVWMPGKNGGADITGLAAPWMALSYAGAGLAAHFRWFWGLISTYRVFEWGTSVSLIVWIAGYFGVLYHDFFS
jgi:hypothetical protein